MANDCGSDSGKKASNNINKGLREGLDIRHGQREDVSVLGNAFRLKMPKLMSSDFEMSHVSSRQHSINQMKTKTIEEMYVILDVIL